MPENDSITHIDGAQIQHGPLSQRIYLMKGCPARPAGLIAKLMELATSHHYGKIFAKIPAAQGDDFLAAGFSREAEIPDFYAAGQGAWFMACYLDQKRAHEENRQEFDELISWTQNRAAKKPPTLPGGARIRGCRAEDSEKMAALYRQVFASYPFPIFEASFLKQSMDDNVDYFSVEMMGQLLALASAEKDEKAGNAEMTDFATLLPWRGHGFAGQLLTAMESRIRQAGFHLAYTIARARTVGMNLTFARAGYNFAGRLVNNTNIGGQIESMNVWYKKLMD